MGKLVPFSSRQEQARVEAALSRAGELLQRRMQAHERLPRLLAALIDAGQQEAVLQAVRAWGRGELAPEEVLEDCEKLAAVIGVDIGSPGTY